MHPQSSPIIARIRTLLLETPFYRPARFFFNKILLFRAKRHLTLDGQSVVLFTPTFKIISELEAMTEREVLHGFLSTLRIGDSVWDVGANIGLYTLFASQRVGNEGHVAAFEPEPHSRSLLERNVGLNGRQNVTILGCALDMENTTRALYPSATPNPGSHSLVQRTDYRVKRRGTVVLAWRGDSLVEQGKAPAPNVVKIDVEGAEMNVLRGMKSLLQSAALRALLIEIHPLVLPLFGSSPDEVEALVRSCGFTENSRSPRSTELHLFARRP